MNPFSQKSGKQVMDPEIDGRNPYAPPSMALSERPSPTGRGELGLFLLWEKLRVVYNLILSVETVLILLLDRPGGLSRERLLGGLAVSALAANVCFCAGPVLDGYARLIVIHHRVITGVIFVSGTILSMFLVHAAIKMIGFEGQERLLIAP